MSNRFTDLQVPLWGSHSNTLLASFNNRIPRYDYLPHTHVSSLNIITPTFPTSEDARSGTQSFGEQFTRRNSASVVESSFPSWQTPSIHYDPGELHASPALSPPLLIRPSPLARTWPNSLTQPRVAPGPSHQRRGNATIAADYISPWRTPTPTSSAMTVDRGSFLWKDARGMVEPSSIGFGTDD